MSLLSGELLIVRPLGVLASFAGVCLWLVCLKVFLSSEIELLGGHVLLASVAFAEPAFVCSWFRC